MQEGIIKAGVLSNCPRYEKKDGWFIIRYGYEPIEDTDYHKFVEHRFIVKPSAERIQSLIAAYNEESGLNEEFSAENYGL